MALKVVDMFGAATLQDSGRPGYRKFGVPVGGAFDKESLSLANGLLGNDPFAPAIEIALGTITLFADGDVTVAIVGAADEVGVNEVATTGNRTVALRVGDRLRIGPPKRGVRTMIALPGGVKGEKMLGSLSGTVVALGDLIQANGAPAREPRALVQPPKSLSKGPLRVLALRDDTDWTDNTYKASHQMDRVGIRLEGDAGVMETSSGRSEPSAFGVVQLTGDGRLVVHGPDGPTIGGYTKLGCVVSADLDRLGQIALGDEVSFSAAR